MLEFGNATERAIRRVGLVPFVYQSVPPREGSIVNNTYLEAMGDLKDCRAVVVVNRQWDARAEWNFAIAELEIAVSEGRHGLVYIVSDDPRRRQRSPSHEALGSKSFTTLPS